MKRRDFLQAGLVLSVLPVPGFANTGKSNDVYLISGFYQGKAHQLNNRLRWMNIKNGQIHELDLTFRAHGLQFNPAQRHRIVLFARRPGRQIALVNLNSGKLLAAVNAEPGYHFYGHGVFTADGNYLYTTENHYSTGQGIIALRDAHSLKVIDRFFSAGIGPHDIRMLSDNKTLVVANGGIRTHPDQPRKKLNLDSMHPSLTYLNRVSGNVIEQHFLADKKLSIRHLDVGPKNEVAIVQQYQGNRKQASQLVAFHQIGEELRIPSIDNNTLKRMNGYTASAAIDQDSATALVSSPKGNLVTLWDLEENRLINSFDLFKPYGVVFSKMHNAYLVSTAGDGVYMLSKQDFKVYPISREKNGSWDNHMILNSHG